jgi:hypothetical protein
LCRKKPPVAPVTYADLTQGFPRRFCGKSGQSTRCPIKVYQQTRYRQQAQRLDLAELLIARDEPHLVVAEPDCVAMGQRLGCDRR